MFNLKSVFKNDLFLSFYIILDKVATALKNLVFVSSFRSTQWRDLMCTITCVKRKQTILQEFLNLVYMYPQDVSYLL